MIGRVMEDVVGASLYCLDDCADDCDDDVDGGCEGCDLDDCDCEEDCAFECGMWGSDEEEDRGVIDEDGVDMDPGAMS